jgi:hypothetical protein
MWLQFFSQDAHFTIHLFAALVCLAVCWLYLDAWLNKHSRVGLLRWLGFGILGISFLVEATILEQSVLGKLTISHDATGIVIVLRLVSFLILIASQLLDPLQAVPETHEINEIYKSNSQAEQEKTQDKPSKRKTSAVWAPAVLTAKWLVPVGAFVVGGLYWRRATKGLERHLKSVAVAFLFIGLADFINLAELLRNTSNPIIFSWVAAFGPIWWVEQLVLLAGVLVLGRWVWSYLTKRFFSQLFMVLISSTVVIFLIVTITFTALLLNSTRSDIVDNLHTAAQVLDYALAAKETETTAGAEQLADSSDIIQAIENRDHNALVSLTANYLPSKKQSSLIITDQYGQVLLRGENPSQWGDSLSGNPLIRQALLGSQNASVSVNQGVATPIVEVSSSVPVISSGQVVGSVTTGINLDQAFVDGLKTKTGLESSVYGNDVVSATTLLAPDGKTPLTGTILDNSKIKSQLLNKGLTYNGSFDINHQSFLGSMIPLKDADNVPVGILMVSQPQSSILKIAGKSVESTFVVTALLLFLSVVPAYMIAKSLVSQIDTQ